MDHFCIYCGRELPPSGVCPCTIESHPKAVTYSPAPPVPQTETAGNTHSYKEEEIYEDAPIPEEAPVQEEDYPSRPYDVPYSKKEAPIRQSTSLIRLPGILKSYCKDPAEASRSLEQHPSISCSISLMLASLCLSALGTLLLGTLYLEDFFFRWFCAGLVAPMIAFGGSFVFAYILTALDRRTLCQDTINPVKAIAPKSLLSTVAASSVFPNLLLTLSMILSPMDKSLKLFQFFALLILVTWVISLLFTLISVYRVRFRLISLLLSIVFFFLALVTMRTLWVWYLTGEFHFAMYLPLSLFGGF